MLQIKNLKNTQLKNTNGLDMKICVPDKKSDVSNVHFSYTNFFSINKERNTLLLIEDVNKKLVCCGHHKTFFTIYSVH